MIELQREDERDFGCGSESSPGFDDVTADISKKRTQFR